MGIIIKESAPSFYCRLDEDTYTATVEKVFESQEQAFGKDDGELEDKINFILKIEDAMYEGKPVEEAKAYLTYKTTKKLSKDERCKLGLIMSKLGLYGPGIKTLDVENAVGKKLRVVVSDHQGKRDPSKIYTTIDTLQVAKNSEGKKVVSVAKKPSKPVQETPVEAKELGVAMDDVVDAELDDLMNM